MRLFKESFGISAKQNFLKISNNNELHPYMDEPGSHSYIKRQKAAAQKQVVVVCKTLPLRM